MRSQPDFAQDPGELFDVVLADGTLTGRSRPRADVHRDGDWHRALHLWVAGLEPDGSPFIMFQQRAAGKDTWPNRLDATVGGHLGAGEDLHDALREVHEEIGIDPDPNSIVALGTRVCANESEAGVIDREIQTVLLLCDDRSLAEYHPNPAEVAAVVRFPLPAMLDFLTGERDGIDAVSMAAGSLPRPARFVLDDFVPNIDRYFYRVCIAASAVLRGEQHFAV